MTDVYLILKNLTRSKLRLFLNGFALFVAFFLFGALGALNAAFDAGVELSADDRLIVVNKINFTQSLPYAYVNKIRAVENVKYVTHANWFGAYFRDQRKPMVGMAVDPESYLKVYDELVLSEEDKSRWFSEQRGMIVGERLASTYGWKVGDVVPISSNIFTNQDGGFVWDMVVSAIFTTKSAVQDTNFMVFHYPYFIETQTFGSGWIGWLIVKTTDPLTNESVIKAIDSQFSNSTAETETSTEQQFNKAFIEQIGSIGLIIQSVLLASFFTILMIVGNTMVLAVRERTREIAVLKTLGFSATRIFKMVMGESLILSCLGGVLGLIAAYFLVAAISKISQVKSMLPNLVVTNEVVIEAIFYIILLGVLTGFLPAYRAMKLVTINALQQN